MVVLRGAFVGLTNTGMLMTAVAMLPDTIEYDRIKTGLRREGIFSGFWMAIEKAGNAMGALVVGLILSLMGFVESAGGAPVEQPDSAITGILIAFSAVPIVLMLAGLVILKAYHLDEESLQALRQQAGP